MTHASHCSAKILIQAPKTNVFFSFDTAYFIPEQVHSIDETIAAEELAHTIRHLRLSSVPGHDELSAAFYKISPDVFGEIFSSIFHCQFQRGILLPSQRNSTVSLLHKPGSRSDTSNYWPISMIQVDVKIATSDMTYRML